MIVYEAFAISPIKRFNAPETPGTDEDMNPGSCQHSSTEEPFEAAIAVMLRDGVVTLLN